jgi:glycerophosphoryl diester phosphodiesterase
MLIGHRGSAKYENTLKGFIDAVEKGAEGIEFDVRASKEGELVVIHDSTIGRVSKSSGFVREHTIKELKKVEMKTSDEKIPALSEVISTIKNLGIIMFIELKEKGLEERTLNLVHMEHAAENSVIISFDKNVVEKIKKLDPSIKTGFIHISPFNSIKIAKRINADYLISCARFVSSSFVKDAHSSYLKVVVWTVDTIKGMKKMEKMDVDGIMSDIPELFRRS